MVYLFLLLTYFVLPTCASHTFMALRCTTYYTGRIGTETECDEGEECGGGVGNLAHSYDHEVSYMFVDHTIKCDAYARWDGDRGGYYYLICIYAWLMIFIYVIGIPLLYVPSVLQHELLTSKLRRVLFLIRFNSI